MVSNDRSVAGVLAAETRRGEALVARDFQALRAMILPDIVHTHTRGVTDDFDRYFHYIENDLAFLEASRGELSVRLFGDVAMMSGPMTNIVLPKGRTEPITSRSQVLQLWVWCEGRWMLAAFQSTTLPQAGQGA